jgi:Tfp pilus assembly protein PilF
MKRASFAALAVLVFLLAHVDASITGAVEGVIKDSVTGQVLEGVKITIVSAKSQMITSELLTDKKGHFYKGGLIPGTHKITVGKGGYLPQEGTARVIMDETVSFDIPLTPSQSAGPAADSISKMILNGSQLLAAGKTGEAIAKFNEAVSQDPKNAVAYFYRAAASEKAGDNDRTLDDYKKAIELKPDFVLAHSRIGIILAKKHEYDNAIEYFKRAVELGDRDPSTHYNYGVCLLNAEKGGEAGAVFEKVLALDPNFADADYQLGLMAIGAGDPAKAKEFLEKFISLDPENKNATLAKEILKNLN